MTPEIISRLTAKSAWKIERLDPVSPKLTASDLAGAMPRNKLQQNLLMAEFMLDERAKRTASYLLHWKVADMVLRHKWPVLTGVPIYKAMSAQCVEEVVTPDLCDKCGGRGVTESRKIPMDCGKCQGTGRGSLTDDRRYTALSRLEDVSAITREDWHRKWKYICDEIYAYALEQKNQGIGYLNYQLCSETA